MGGVLCGLACGDDGGAPPVVSSGMDAAKPDGPTSPAPDAGGPDARMLQDARVLLDATVPVPDAGTDASLDAGPSGDADAGPDAGPTDVAGRPVRLSDTGLFTDVASETLADGVMAYRPRFELWSDTAAKRRWLYLPPGTQIDTTDMDDWQFPVGTKAWKEFVRDNVRVETRLLEKTDAGWQAMAYLWRDDGSDADAVPDGVLDAKGTSHDVPDEFLCEGCHAGRPDQLLGVSAIQLAHNQAGTTLTDLQQAGVLTVAPPAALPVPGDGNTVAVLGALHANCGHCHNPDSGEAFGKAPGLELWLTVADLATVADTPAHRTTLGVDLEKELAGYTKRVVAGQPGQSGLVARVEVMRGSSDAMPPFATEIVDDEFAMALRTWIMSLSP